MQNKLTGKLISNRIYLVINIISLLLCINLQYGFIKEINSSQWVLIFFPFIGFAPFILVAYFFMFKKLFNIANPDKTFIILNLVILLYLTAVEYMYLLKR